MFIYIYIYRSLYNTYSTECISNMHAIYNVYVHALIACSNIQTNTHILDIQKLCIHTYICIQSYQYRCTLLHRKQLNIKFSQHYWTRQHL